LKVKGSRTKLGRRLHKQIKPTQKRQWNKKPSPQSLKRGRDADKSWTAKTTRLWVHNFFEVITEHMKSDLGGLAKRGSKAGVNATLRYEIKKSRVRF